MDYFSFAISWMSKKSAVSLTLNAKAFSLGI
jgi:hypothetical protein